MVVLLVVGEGGGDVGAGESCEQGVDGGAVGLVRGGVFGELRRRGYTPLSMVGELRQVGRLSGWLEAGGLSAADLSGERVEQFLAWQRAAGGHRGQWSRPGLVCLLEVLAGLGVLVPERSTPASSPLDLLLVSFARYLVSERGLAAGTIVGYVTHARWFLEGLGREGVTGLSAAEVTGAVLRKAASGVSVAAAQYFVSGLRAFLRFCFLEGLVGSDLSQAALVVRGRRASLLPRGISARTPVRCWTPAIVAARLGGVITR